MKTYFITFLIIEILIFLYIIYSWFYYKPRVNSSFWKEGGKIVFLYATYSNIFLSFILSAVILVLNFLER